MWKRKEKKDREKGMITVEAVLSLVPFILVILGIISFTNIFVLHNRIQYALYEAGSELTAYTYFYEVSGLRKADKTFTADADEQTEVLDTTIEKVSAFIEQLGTLQTSVQSENGLGEVKGELDNTVDAGKEAASAAGDLLSDPQQIISGTAYLAMENVLKMLKTGALTLFMKARLSSYLEVDVAGGSVISADDYLKAAGVKDGISGLDFSKSKLFMDKEKKMIDVIVTYDVEISFFKLFFQKPAITIAQRCAIPAWLDGDGESYK